MVEIINSGVWIVVLLVGSESMKGNSIQRRALETSNISIRFSILGWILGIGYSSSYFLYFVCLKCFIIQFKN